jgi:hypothetical protein
MTLSLKNPPSLKENMGYAKIKKIINAKKGHEEKSMLKKQARNNIHAKVQEKKEESPCSLKWKSKEGERVMKKEATPRRV